MRNLSFAGLRKRIAFRHSWQRQQGSRQDSVPGMTKSSLELALGTLEVLPCTAGRSPGVQGDWKPTRQCSPRARERVYLGSQVKLHSVPQLVRNGKRWHRYLSKLVAPLGLWWSVGLVAILSLICVSKIHACPPLPRHGPMSVTLRKREMANFTLMTIAALSFYGHFKIN